MNSLEAVSSIRVLVVDDSPVLRDAVRRILSESETLEVCGEACNGYEALEKAAKMQPEVILMDIGMPAMDGLEATRRLRRVNCRSEVLIFTEHDSVYARDACLEAGARGYLSKSHSTDLAQAIRTVANHQTYGAGAQS